MRSIKPAPVARPYASKLRTLIQGIHVVPTEDAAWEVRTLGTKSLSRRFASKGDALDFAHSIRTKPSSKILLHKTASGTGSNGVVVLRRDRTAAGKVKYRESQLH